MAAHLSPTLNPAKTLTKTSFFPSLSLPKSKPNPKLKALSLPPMSLQSLTTSDHKDHVIQAAQASLSNCLSETNLHHTVPSLKSKIRGKVRDIYDAGDYLVLVTTDRQSAFDRILASIPFKGQVLNETSLWWFDRTRHITPNAVVSMPDNNVTIAKKCIVFPVEFVVRGFVTGSTDTSLWTVYNRGVRNYCGNALPDGMLKNQKLSANILTPTTKAADHDVPVTPEEIVERGLMTQDEYNEASTKALSLFEYGQHIAKEHGLLLVDTKYEFGKGPDGTILLIDEVHTPDSSRYWIAHSYEERFQAGLEPDNIDKEFLRLWFKDHCNPYEDEIYLLVRDDYKVQISVARNGGAHSCPNIKERVSSIVIFMMIVIKVLLSWRHIIVFTSRNNIQMPSRSTSTPHFLVVHNSEMNFDPRLGQPICQVDQNF